MSGFNSNFGKDYGTPLDRQRERRTRRTETRTESTYEEELEETKDMGLGEGRKDGENEDVYKSFGTRICGNLRKEGYKGNGRKRELNIDIWHLRSEGLSYIEIAEELNINKVTVYRHLRKDGRLR